MNDYSYWEKIDCVCVRSVWVGLQSVRHLVPTIFISVFYANIWNWKIHTDWAWILNESKMSVECRSRKANKCDIQIKFTIFKTIWCLFASQIHECEWWLGPREKEREFSAQLFSTSKRNFNRKKQQNRRKFKEKANSCVNTDLCVVDIDVRHSDIQLKSLEHHLNAFLVLCPLQLRLYLYYYDFTEHILLVYLFMFEF